MWNFLRTFCFVDTNSTECGGNVTGSYGFLYSINYPASYPKNLDCYWTVISPEGTTLTVRLLYIALNGSCKNEFLEVTEDGNGFRMCNRIMPAPFQTSGNVVNVHFVSDNKSDPSYYLGFSLEWKVTSMYTLHKEHLTWKEAHEVCSLNAGELLYEYDVTEMASLIHSDDITTVWQGKYLTQWVWLEGCYKLDGNDFGSPVILQANQMMKCLDHCHHTNYFGLQADKCYCFNSFAGRRLPSGKNCTRQCDGNHKERCGSNDTLTIYMNDICYDNSTQWTGTVARSYSGKSCISWTNITAKDLTFPDDSVLNASNYCRDPDSSSFLWCYINITHSEQCDIPKCIAKEANDASSCMVYRSPRKQEDGLRFKQKPCNEKAKTSCLSKHGTLTSDRNVVDWTVARITCRGNTYESQNIVGPSVFRLHRYYKIRDDHWLGYFRTKATVVELPPAQQPSECFILTKTNGTPHESVTGCQEKMPFICQHVPITCGGDLSGSHGEISSPGYPTGYGAYLHCHWNLVVATGDTITLSYEVDIENSSSCRKDSLEIIDQNNDNALMLCGETMGTFQATGNAATIRFLSDKTVHETTGFRLTWRSISGPRADEHSGGTNTGLILTLIVGLLCIVGIVLLVAAVVRYRKTAGIGQRLDAIACKFKTRRVTKADISVPQPDGKLEDDNDIDHVSGASFNVSNDSNSQSDDGGSYLNITFRQGPSSKLNNSISMENITYASPQQYIDDINETLDDKLDNSQAEEVSYEDIDPTDTEAINKVEGVDAAVNKAADIDAAGYKAADIDAAGYKAADIDAAGYKAQGSDAAVNKEEGIDAAGYKAEGIDTAVNIADDNDTAGYKAEHIDAAVNKAENNDAEFTNRTDDMCSNGRVLYSYARESGFPKDCEIVEEEDMGNTYDTYDVNVHKEEYNSLSW